MTSLVEQEAVELLLGDTSVRCCLYGAQGADRLYVNLHENERAAVEAARSVLDRSERLFHFDAGGGRWLRFSIGSDRYAVDPNRIFSVVGVRASLLHCCGSAPTPAIEAVQEFSESLLRLWSLKGRRVVVALHNTGDYYSVLAYQPGGSEAANAVAVQVVQEQHRHDFFLVTSAQDFDEVARLGFNVVQEVSDGDDGSLSVYCTARGLRYINIEARFDAAPFQAEMIAALQQILD